MSHALHMQIVPALIVCAAATGALAAEPMAVPPDAAATWIRWTLPMPKQIEIPRKVVLAPDQVRIRARREAGPAERTACEQLRALFAERAGVQADGEAFEIVLGVCDAEGRVRHRPAIDPDRLRGVRNSEQAYAIVPYADDELVLTGLTDAGVYYAAQTLRQLLEATLTEESVEIPLAEVLDWPDLSERGEWGGSSVRDIEWMAAHKMNLVETHVREMVDEDGTPTVEVNEEAIALGRRNALKVVPIITHLDHLLRTGVYDAYPELVGRGYDVETADRGLIAPCASQPQFIDVLAGWMDGMSSIDGVTDICAWLSEAHVQCRCPRCQRLGQYVLESRAIVEAYRRNQQKHPDVGLRILLTQGSYSTNDEVLAEVPPDVGVTYYDGGRTYDSSRDEMIYPLLEDYAAQGRWLGCYPQLTASWRIVCPWTGPQFIHYRMNEFVDDGLECLCGYATPDNICYQFNVLAAAEWSWNARGRSPREFAAAWATREGFEDPDAVAEWAVRMGPVGWDLYGSRVPYSAFFGRAASLVKQGAVPTLGEGMYRYFPTLEHLDADIETCRWAAETAHGWDAPALVAEAEAIGGMLRMLRTIYDMGVVLADETLEPETARPRLNEEMYEMALASFQAEEAMRDWRDALEGWDGASRFDDTLEVIGQTASEIGEHLRQFGIRDPGLPYRTNTIGQWNAEDFEESRRIEKTFEVTELLQSPGTYQVGFRYTSGWHGLVQYAVRLLAAPKDAPEETVEIAVDEHRGVAAHRNEANVYTVEVPEVDRSRAYFIRVDIQGTADSGQPPGRKGCSGNVWMRKEGSLDPDAPPPELEPMTPEQAARFGPPAFQSDRIHVGVLPAAYGSGGIHSWLARQETLEVLPVARISPDVVAPCDAVVIPQPKVVSVVGGEEVAALRDYVSAGGGLVVTHDAAGFRGLPAILPEICAAGIDKERHADWVVVAEHPVTEGIPPDQAQPHSYYDHILLEPGPSGVVLARSAETEDAVVIAGEHGEGRYVAIGLAVGLAEDGSDVEPEGAEARLLLNAVTWAAG